MANNGDYKACYCRIQSFSVNTMLYSSENNLKEAYTSGVKAFTFANPSEFSKYKLSGT